MSSATTMENTSGKKAPFASQKRREEINGIIATVVLTIGSVIVLIPLIWMLSTALKSDAEIYTNSSFVPKAWAWNNFVKAWTSAPFGTYLKNTIIITGLCLVGTLLSNSLVAYGFARIRFKGRNIIFAGVLATMMIPGIVTMIPAYILFSRIGWVGTFLPLIVPAFTGSAYYIFLLRQSFMGIPKAYSEAAKIEGANELTIFSRIFVPMSKPVLTAITVFEFNAKWNDFMGPLLYLSDEKKYTLQIGLRTFRGDFGMEWQKFMAASLLVLLPTIILFFFMQKYIIEGVAIGGVKG
jgi:multiple sugar transport system permease protein